MDIEKKMIKEVRVIRKYAKKKNIKDFNTAALEFCEKGLAARFAEQN